MTEENIAATVQLESVSAANFVNIDGHWINPAHVVRVTHHSEYGPTQKEAVEIVLTHGRLVLEEWSARQCCQVVDKLEGNTQPP